MYERFTTRAHALLKLAHKKTRALQHNYIGTEHMLLALIEIDDCNGQKALKIIGVDLAALRRNILGLISPGPEPVTAEKLSQTPRVKMAIEYAMAEARALNHNYVGTEHILLGLIRENDGLAAQVLELKHDVKIDRARAAVLAVLQSGTPISLELAAEIHQLKLDLHKPEWTDQQAVRYARLVVLAEKTLAELVATLHS